MATKTRHQVLDVENGNGELWRLYDAICEDGEVTEFLAQRMIMPLNSMEVFNFWSTIRITFDANSTDGQILDGMRKIVSVASGEMLA